MCLLQEELQVEELITVHHQQQQLAAVRVRVVTLPAVVMDHLPLQALRRISPLCASVPVTSRLLFRKSVRPLLYTIGKGKRNIKHNDSCYAITNLLFIL